MTRPGGRVNVWVRDETTGEIVLRDDGGAEYARFEDAGAVFADPEPYPRDGERTVKQPIIPETFDVAAEDLPAEEIVAVPEGADGLGDLSLVVDADGLTVAADAVGEEDATPAPDDLDVEAVAAEAEAVPDRSDRTIRNWVGALVDAGALKATGERRDRSEILRVLGN